MHRTFATVPFVARLGVVLVAASALAGPGPSVDVAGPVVYRADGVELEGRKTLWRDLRSLEDVAPSAEAVAAEFKRRVTSRADDIASHLRLGDWARDAGLAVEARTEYEAALALDGESAAARRALGWVRVDKDWRKTAEVYEERRAALPDDAKAPRLELAKWCAENGCPEGEWQMLVEVDVLDPWDKAMIARVKPIVERRRQRTPLVPPLDGDWRAEPDKSRHHQAKAYAMEAIDFRRYDDTGKLFRGTGKRLEDYYGFDAVIRACADGEITDVVDNYPDLPPGVAGNYDDANYVEITHEADEHTDYGHIRRGSALVKLGDRVKAGQPIARVGNSGASGTPHLHFTLELPVWDGKKGEILGIPWRLSGFRVVEAGGVACDFQAKVARVGEGWRVIFPERGEKEAR